MRAFIYPFIIPWVIINGSSSFAEKKEYPQQISAISTEIRDVSYRNSTYNLFFESTSEAYRRSLVIIHFSNDKQYIDTMPNYIVNNMVVKSYLLYPLYLNETYGYNNEWSIIDHSDRNIAILDYSRSIGRDTVVVLGFVHKQKLYKSTIGKTLGLGINHQLTPQIVFGIGTGLGIDKEPPDFRVTAGFQFYSSSE